ncbi:MAG: 50S ribosomal protein L11 methyltransferase [Clostridia bacterium]|nr:50S ribosomal protein L11 methyltransferase [Clostridia bacterium]
MKYIKLEIQLNREAIEPLLGELMALGITDTVVEDPQDVEDILRDDFHKYDYVDEGVKAILEERPKLIIYMNQDEESLRKAQDVHKAVQKLSADFKAGVYGDSDFGDLLVSQEILDDESWRDKWKEYFLPTRICGDLVVKPSWQEYEKKANDLVIEIDPGMAFGTGTHETTSLCMKLMEKYLKKGDSLLDVGTGSGILAIGAELLGASDILGVDIDPVAVQVAKENVELNNPKSIIKIQYGDLTKGLDYQANVVVANLMADLVIMLSDSVKKHVAPGGYFISSGILVEKEELVSQAIKAAGFDIVEILEDGEWCAIAARAN